MSFNLKKKTRFFNEFYFWGQRSFYIYDATEAKNNKAHFLTFQYFNDNCELKATGSQMQRVVKVFIYKLMELVMNHRLLRSVTLSSLIANC